MRDALLWSAILILACGLVAACLEIRALAARLDAQHIRLSQRVDAEHRRITARPPAQVTEDSHIEEWHTLMAQAPPGSPKHQAFESRLRSIGAI